MRANYRQLHLLAQNSKHKAEKTKGFNIFATQKYFICTIVHC